MARYGAVCDNVLATEVVLADGRLVAANPREHADLFWAIRGGGGNFGIVTASNIGSSVSTPCCQDSCISQSPARRRCFASTAT